MYVLNLWFFFLIDAHLLSEPCLRKIDFQFMKRMIRTSQNDGMLLAKKQAEK